MTRSAWNQRPLLLGMVHLQPLPGSPRHRPERGRQRPGWLAEAIADARALSRAGFDGVIVENFGDTPFYPRRVPPVTIAGMAVAAAAVRSELPRDLLVGINVLRNDAVAALGIAAAVGADLVRVNVLSGAMVTDQGIVQGDAAELIRMRRDLAPGVRVFADVRVKHARPLAPRPLEDEVIDLDRTRRSRRPGGSRENAPEPKPTRTRSAPCRRTRLAARCSWARVARAPTYGPSWEMRTASSWAPPCAGEDASTQEQPARSSRQRARVESATLAGSQFHACRGRVGRCAKAVTCH